MSNEMDTCICCSHPSGRPKHYGFVLCSSCRVIEEIIDGKKHLSVETIAENNKRLVMIVPENVVMIPTRYLAKK